MFDLTRLAKATISGELTLPTGEMVSAELKFTSPRFHPSRLGYLGACALFSHRVHPEALSSYIILLESYFDS
jgi:hypothetical protein